MTSWACWTESIDGIHLGKDQNLRKRASDTGARWPAYRRRMALSRVGLKHPIGDGRAHAVLTDCDEDARHKRSLSTQRVRLP
jgi:hypothetical protein